MAKAGSTRNINGDDYLVIYDHGEMETLQKDGFISIFFPNMPDISKMGVLIPLGKVKKLSQKMVAKPDSLQFNGVSFAKEGGYTQPTLGVKGFYAKLHSKILIFNIDNSGNLVGVSLK